MVKVKNPFKDRPTLPSREQIIADLASASDDDVVFQDSKNLSLTSIRPTEEVKSKHLAHGSKASKEQTSSTTKDQQLIESTYQNVTQLIHLQAKLTSEPTVVQEKYESLQKLGQEMSESISELKSAAESVIKK